jgi:hypothetical protein
MLNAMRFARLDDRMIERFSQLKRPVKYEDGIEPTELWVTVSCASICTDICPSYPTRVQVDTANHTRLQRLPGQAHTYQSLDTPGQDDKGERVSENRATQLLNGLVVQRELRLKAGAQVMLVKVRKAILFSGQKQI